MFRLPRERRFPEIMDQKTTGPDGFAPARSLPLIERKINAPDRADPLSPDCHRTILASPARLPGLEALAGGAPPL